MRIHLLAGATALALGALGVAPAIAAPVANPVMLSGTVDGSWQYDTIRGGGASANGNLWAINGSIVVPVEQHWFIQGNAGYNNLDVSGVRVNNGYVAGSAGWADAWGRVGGTVSYTGEDFSAGGTGFRVDSWSYGVYGDWYATPQITAAARVGGLSGNINAFGGSIDYHDAWYIGGHLKGYITPDVALSGGVDYNEIRVSQFGMGANFRTTGAGVSGEWMPSHEYPFVVSVNYNYSSTSVGGIGTGSINSNAIGLGLKYHFGGPANGSLTDHDRSGTDDVGTSPLVNTRLIF